MNAIITNPNDIEISRNLALAFINESGKIAFVGDSFLLTLPPKGSVEKSWASNLTRQLGQGQITSATKLYPALYESQMGLVVYQEDKTVTMYPDPGSSSVTANLEVLDAEKKKNLGMTVFYVENASDFKVQSSVKVSSGYFTDQVYLGIYTPVPGSNRAYITNTYPLSFVFLNKNESDTWTTTVSIPSAEVDDTYYLGLLDSNFSLMSETLNNMIVVLGNDPNAGIESVIEGENDILFLYDKSTRTLNITGGNNISDVEAFYLNGVKAPVSTQFSDDKAFIDFSLAGKGIVIVSVSDRMGNRKSVKIAL